MFKCRERNDQEIVFLSLSVREGLQGEQIYLVTIEMQIQLENNNKKKEQGKKSIEWRTNCDVFTGSKRSTRLINE